MGKEKSSYIIEDGNSKELSEFQDYLLNVRRYSSNTVSSYSFDICDFTKFIRGLGKIFKDIKVDDVKSWILDLTERQIGKRSNKKKDVFFEIFLCLDVSSKESRFRSI